MAESGPSTPPEPSTADVEVSDRELLLALTGPGASRLTLFEIQKSSPLELGFGWLVHLKKPYFVGQQALREEKERGPAWLTVGLEIDLGALEKIYAEFGMPLQLPQEAWADATPIFREGKQIGKATSGTWSPVLKKYIAIARVKPECAAPGTIVELQEIIEAQNRLVRAKVVKTPFFDPERKRA